MVNFRFFVIAGAALFLCRSAVRGAPNLSFHFGGGRTELNSIVLAPVDLGTGQFPSVSFTTPDGKSTGVFANGSGYGTGESFPDWSQVQASAAGQWQLTVNDGAVPSVCNYSTDLSGINADAIPTINTVTWPPLNLASTTPSFHWTDAGDFTEAYVQLWPDAPAPFVDYSADLSPSQTSWTSPIALAPGMYEFFLQLPSPLYTIPLNSTLVSGPALTLPTTTDFQSTASFLESFTVVPEPMHGLMLLALPALALRRWRAEQP